MAAPSVNQRRQEIWAAIPDASVARVTGAVLEKGVSSTAQVENVTVDITASPFALLIVEPADAPNHWRLAPPMQQLTQAMIGPFGLPPSTARVVCHRWPLKADGNVTPEPVFGVVERNSATGAQRTVMELAGFTTAHLATAVRAGALVMASPNTFRLRTAADEALPPAERVLALLQCIEVLGMSTVLDAAAPMWSVSVAELTAEQETWPEFLRVADMAGTVRDLVSTSQVALATEDGSRVRLSKEEDCPLPLKLGWSDTRKLKAVDAFRNTDPIDSVRAFPASLVEFQPLAQDHGVVALDDETRQRGKATLRLFSRGERSSIARLMGVHEDFTVECIRSGCCPDLEKFVGFSLVHYRRWSFGIDAFAASMASSDSPVGVLLSFGQALSFSLRSHALFADPKTIGNALISSAYVAANVSGDELKRNQPLLAAESARKGRRRRGNVVAVAPANYQPGYHRFDVLHNMWSRLPMAQLRQAVAPLLRTGDLSQPAPITPAMSDIEEGMFGWVFEIDHAAGMYTLSEAAQQLSQAAIDGSTVRLRWGWCEPLGRRDTSQTHPLGGCLVAYSERLGLPIRLLPSVTPLVLRFAAFGAVVFCHDPSTFSFATAAEFDDADMKRLVLSVIHTGEAWFGGLPMQKPPAAWPAWTHQEAEIERVSGAITPPVGQVPARRAARVAAAIDKLRDDGVITLAKDRLRLATRHPSRRNQMNKLLVPDTPVDSLAIAQLGLPSEWVTRDELDVPLLDDLLAAGIVRLQPDIKVTKADSAVDVLCNAIRHGVASFMNRFALLAKEMLDEVQNQVRATDVLDAALRHSERWRYTHLADEPLRVGVYHLLFAQFEMAVKLKHVTVQAGSDGVAYVTAADPLPADLEHNYAEFVKLRELAAGDTRSDMVRVLLERLAPRLRAYYEHDGCPERGWTITRDALGTLIQQECGMSDKAERNQLIAEGIKFQFLIATSSRTALALPSELIKPWRKDYVSSNGGASASAAATVDDESKSQKRPAKKAQQPRSSDVKTPVQVEKAAKVKGKNSATTGGVPSKEPKPLIKAGSRETQLYGAGLLADKVRSERATQPEAKWAGLNRAQAGAVLSAAHFSSKALRNEALRAAVDPALGGKLVERNGMLVERDDPLAQQLENTGPAEPPVMEVAPPVPDTVFQSPIMPSSASATSTVSGDSLGGHADRALSEPGDAPVNDDDVIRLAPSPDATEGHLEPAHHDADDAAAAHGDHNMAVVSRDLDGAISRAFDTFAAKHDVDGSIATAALFEQLLPVVLQAAADPTTATPGNSAFLRPPAPALGHNYDVPAARCAAVGTRTVSGGDDFDAVTPAAAAATAPRSALQRDAGSPIDRAGAGPAEGKPARTLAEIRAKHGLVHRMDPQEEEEPAAEPVDFDWG